MLELAEIFALDICAYAVMSNHYHVVLYVDAQTATNWSRKEVIERWHQLFSGNLLSRRYLGGESLSKAEMAALDESVVKWRERLMSISWFMRVLNEGLARKANAEDNCTGRLVSRPREFHPQPLSEPYVTLSRHTAPVI